LSPAPVWVRAWSLTTFYLMGVATPFVLSVIQIVRSTQDTLEAAIRAVEIPGTIIHIWGEHFKVFFMTQVVTMLIIVDTVAVLRVTARPAHALHLR